MSIKEKFNKTDKHILFGFAALVLLIIFGNSIVSFVQDVFNGKNIVIDLLMSLLSLSLLSNVGYAKNSYDMKVASQQLMKEMNNMLSIVKNVKEANAHGILMQEMNKNKGSKLTSEEKEILKEALDRKKNKPKRIES